MAKRTRDQLEAAAEAIVAQFDSLPDDAHVRVRVVAKLKACSVATVWRNCRSGKWAPPEQISDGIVAWRVGNLRKEPRRAA
jgi:prophage regulatory protein